MSQFWNAQTELGVDFSHPAMTKAGMIAALLTVSGSG
jgi:hypothetical protein